MKHISFLFLLLVVKTCSSSTYPNVALHGKATHCDQNNEVGAASNAIDEDRDSNYDNRSCSHTALQTNPWWRVDLLEPYIVTSITVTNRGDCCAERLDGAEIRVGNSLINNGNDNPVAAVISHIPAGDSQTFTFNKLVEGHYVNVYLPGTEKYLTLCEVEVYGYQAKANVALRGTATQSDQYNELGAASNAIDGNRDSNYYHRSCSHTTLQTNPWWTLDLLEPYVITSITVTNRGDCCPERLDGAEIRIGNSLINNGNDNPVAAVISHIPAGQAQTFTFTKLLDGRYVNVYLPGTEKYLTLCEVEVYGYQAKANVALQGKATQCDQYNELRAASSAIDGNRDSNYDNRSCSHTALQTNPWWRVDLLQRYVITAIIVTNRGDCCPERLDGAEIRVGSLLINDGNDNPVAAVISHIPAGDSEILTFNNLVEGRYVNVYLPGTDKYLTLCEVEVYGYQAKANVALHGKATQCDQNYKYGAASNAIDGNRDSIYHHNSCSHTDLQTNPWWKVDLLEPYVVTSIIVTNRGDCCAERLDGAQIRVGNSLINNGNDNPVAAVISHIPAGQAQTFTFTEHVEGRYVNVYLPGTEKYLTLCEVEVYGYQLTGF